MDFNEIQDLVLKNIKRYSKKHKVKMDDYFTMLKLYEEVGELSQAFLVYKKKSRPAKFKPEVEARKDVAKELADVFTNVVLLSKLLNIDLEDALERKVFYKVREK